MTCIRFTDALLLLLLNQVCTENPAVEFKAEGGNFVLGYCFGVDYIVVYRSAPEGDQLLGNSSNIHLLETLPADLRGRVHFNEDPHLLGLRIENLTALDSGKYRRECWNNQLLVSQHAKQLSVCKEEFPSEEITVNEEGRAELFCNSTSIGLPGVSVHWYHETYLADNPVLFLDSSVSLKPMIPDLQGAVEAINDGAVLVLDKTALKNNMQFYCLVIEGENCIGLQNMYQADSSETIDVYPSEGDRVVLQCTAEGNQLQWETPLGEINSNSTGNNQMYVSTVESDFSLIIPVLSNEHGGMYSCISPAHEIQYSLVLCPTTKSQGRVADKGQNVSLECSFPPDASHKVLWYRYDLSEHYKVFSDSEDHSVPLPEDLRGRVSLSHYEHMLNISDLDMKNTGVYGCILLTSSGFLDGDDDDGDDGDYSDYDDEDGTGDYYSDGGIFEPSEKCIFKQETVLNVIVGNGDRNASPAVPTDSPPSNATGYAVVAGLVGLVVLVAVVVVIVKKRKNTSSKTGSNIPMEEDAACRDRLTSDGQVP